MRETRVQIPPDPDYDGRKDYQGNHDIFEMPEDQKPTQRFKLPPLNKIALAIILIGIIVAVGLVFVSMFQQSVSFTL